MNLAKHADELEKKSWPGQIPVEEQVFAVGTSWKTMRRQMKWRKKEPMWMEGKWQQAEP